MNARTISPAASSARCATTSSTSSSPTGPAWWAPSAGSAPTGPGGRLDLYRGDPPLSDGAFRVLHTLVRSAAENLERFDARFQDRSRTLSERALTLAALASLRLDSIASPDGIARLEQALESARRRLEW
jgi:hypothetical protein